MAKFKVKKIANVAVNNDIVVNEVATIVANEIVNNDIPVSDIPVNNDIPVSDIPVDSDIPVSDIPVDSEIDDEDDDMPELQSEFKIISLDDIVIKREDNRLSGMDSESISQFAQVLKRDKGVRIPIEVYYDSTISKYRVISGHRRYLASIEAGFRHIKTMVYEIDHNSELGKKNIFKMRIIENIERVNLSPIDTATQMRIAVDEMGMTKKATAALFSLKGTRKYYGSDVTKIISLLQLPEESQMLVHKGLMSKKSAYEILEGDQASREITNKALKSLKTHIENLNKKQANKLVESVIQVVATENPDSGIPIHPPTTESNDSEIETPESNNSEVPESRIDPNLKLTPESMFPEPEEPNPVQSRRSSPNDITPPTSQNQNESESDFDVERQLAEARKSDRNKEMSREQIIAFLYDIEVGVQGFPISGFFEDLMSAIAGNEESKSEMISLLKDLVLAPKKSKKK
jgi:ParB/RepB/Spo0J family partition protein